MKNLFQLFTFPFISFSVVVLSAKPVDTPARPNVLFIISDDLCSTALSCYGNTVCRTPNIDRLAAEGTRFTRAYCQATYCGPSRASFMSGYYPTATGVLGYVSGRKAIGDRATWAQHFKNNGYYSARVSKIFHMGVPGGIEKGGDGADDPRSWTERFNSPGPEWKAPGDGETLENNPDGKKPAVGGNTFVVVKADGDDMVHSDGKTAARACEIIAARKDQQQPFWLGVGFVRPHVPFVAPRPYFEPYPDAEMSLPPKLPGDWDDIPKPGINYKTSVNMKMNVSRQKKAVAGYYASVAFVDKLVGQILDTLSDTGLDDNTIVIFTSDHGYHLGEHDFWAKVSLHEESVLVPLIMRAPGKAPAVCHSLVELLDLYPTLSGMCDLEVPDRLQGKNIAPLLDDPDQTVREEVLTVNGKGSLLRGRDWAYMQYKGNSGEELYDMRKDPEQFHNLAGVAEHAETLGLYRQKLAKKIEEVRTNDLPLRSKALKPKNKTR